MTTSRPVSIPIRMVAVTVAGMVVLSGCIDALDSTPRPTATVTVASPGPDDIPVGTLLDDHSVAWEGVEGWVSEARIQTLGDGSSESTASVSMERVNLPSQRHILTTNGDTVVSEEVVVDGTVYMRGAMVSSSIYPDVDAETWISFTPELAPPETVLEQRVAYITSPPAYPFADVSAETRALSASPAGEVLVEDQLCEAWEYSTTTEQAGGLDVRLSFDAEGRPCQLVRAAEGVVETTTWIYPQELEPIVAPAEATPVLQFPSDPT
jgi:hypothetical protein